MNLLRLPLVAATLAFLAGSLSALRYTPPPLPFLLAAIGLALLGMFAARGMGSTLSGWVGSGGVLLLAFGFAGVALGSTAAREAATDCRWQIPDGARFTASGIFLANFHPVAHGAGSAPAQAGSLLPFRLRELRTDAGTSVACGGDVRMRLPGDGDAILAGSEVVVRGEWRRFAPPVISSRWPRRPEQAGLADVERVIRISPASFSKAPLLTLRGRVARRLDRLFPNHSALAEALLLGRRESIDPALRERFANAGLSHLLAISGMHVGMIAGILLLVGRIWFSLRSLVWPIIGILAAYLAMIGAPPSALRAGVMVSLGLLSFRLQRPTAGLAIVASAALLILVFRPLALLEPGFQLSFGGVIGILLLRDAALRQLPATWRTGRARWGVEAAVVSAAAFLATAPIAAYHFGTVAPVAIVANLPAIPLMSLALIGILSALLLDPIIPAVASLFASAAGGALDLLGRVAEIAASLPYGHSGVARPAGWLLLLGIATVLLALDAAGRLRPPLRWATAMMAVAGVLLAAPAVARHDSVAAGAGLEIHFLDVGQGDATAIRTPAGRWILVDAGPRTENSDAGARRILPFLRAHGARRLDALILTHPDADHIGGVVALLRGIPVGRVIEPGLPVGKPLYLELLREVEARDVAWNAARAGETLRLDGVDLTLLWPDSAAVDTAQEANEVSAVLQLRYGNFSALVPGDAPASVEQLLVAHYGSALRSQVLKAGHHGSRTSTTEEWLDAVRPELIVISAGRRNRYGHPAPDVLRRLRRHGIAVARTDREGTISLRITSGADAALWRRIGN